MKRSAVLNGVFSIGFIAIFCISAYPFATARTNSKVGLACPQGLACSQLHCHPFVLVRTRAWCMPDAGASVCCSGTCEVWKCSHDEGYTCPDVSYGWSAGATCEPYTCSHTSWSPCNANEDLCCLPNGLPVSGRVSFDGNKLLVSPASD